jgi:hypothetical protein
MGASASASKPKGVTGEVKSSEQEVSHHWKMLPSIDEARGKFKADGTLAKSIDPGHLELRTLLDEPLGQHSIGQYAKQNHCHESFMCWVDLQEFKTIPDDALQYRRSKGLHIHQKYIKVGGVSEFGGIDPEDRDRYHELLTQSGNDPKVLTANFFDKVQMQCFVDIYQNTFKRFKQTEQYAQLKKSKSQSLLLPHHCRYLAFKMKYNSVKLDDFWYFEKLGEGGFGFVVHCQKKTTQKHYAMKIQTKLGLLDCYSDDMSRVDFEKQAFASCQHPFIINLDYAFQSDNLVIMALGLCTGE